MPSRIPAPDTIVWSAPCVRAPGDDRELSTTHVEVCREGDKFVVVVHQRGERRRDSRQAMKLDRAMAHADWLSRGAP